MTLKELLDNIDGLAYVVNGLELSGSRARRYVMDIPFMTTWPELERFRSFVHQYQAVAERPECRSNTLRLLHLFTQVHDIHATLTSLKNGVLLNEIDLFEIKSFAFLALEFNTLIGQYGPETPSPIVQNCLEDLRQVICALDPDGHNVPTFYLYNSYSEKLAALRRQHKACEAACDEARTMALWDEILCEEQHVLTALCRRLQPYARSLETAFHTVGWTEVYIAMARRNMALGFTAALFSLTSDLTLSGMFHPQVADRLQQDGRSFQPVDIALRPGSCLLTGANMSGKTVVLKTIALVQTLAQLGFDVPAAQARLPLVEAVYLLCGDKQDADRGLSSFAAEMLEMDRMLAQVKDTTRRFLILVDEPARTTNPEEGRALVCALTQTLQVDNINALISTHYSHIGKGVLQWRVIGFDPTRLHGALTPDSINACINHNLTLDQEQTVPHEALRIARLLGVDPAFLEQAEKNIAP